MPTERRQLVNRRTGCVLADRLIPAFDSQSRNTGLLKHSTLEVGVAMVIAPCSAVHTWFMKFPIDVIFAARDGRVLKVRPDLKAWRMSGAIGAFAVIELAAGGIPSDAFRVGDYLDLASAF